MDVMGLTSMLGSGGSEDSPLQVKFNPRRLL
jgi:hypothetical protein